MRNAAAMNCGFERVWHEGSRISDKDETRSALFVETGDGGSLRTAKPSCPGWGLALPDP